jgi:hypothetical protein
MLTFLITTIIAGGGIIISYLQLQTAQTRISIDIFEKRYKIYEDLRTAVSVYLTTGNFTAGAQSQFMQAQTHARFYFGGEVDQYLSALRRDLIDSHFWDRFASGKGLPIDNQLARLDRINDFYAEIDAMFIPYMRLNQRMPLWWWSDCRAKLSGWLQQMKR